LEEKVIFVGAMGSPSQRECKFCHIGIVRPSLSDTPSFFNAIWMSEMSPIRKMIAVRKPRMTGVVKKSDKAVIIGFLERVGMVERSLLVEERTSQKVIEEEKVRAFRKRA
jgi:hypothetical protein